MPQGMKFQFKDLGTLDKGATVEIRLSGSAANVRLMNGSNFRAYKSNRNHQYIGGQVKRSPHRMVVPRRDHWYITVDMAGLRGTSRWSVSVEPPPLPVARSTPSRNSLAGVRHELPPSAAVLIGEKWDVFISHASEDKEAVAVPLFEALAARGVKVWMDIAELRIGDSLRQKIDAGLARSKFGVVIFSESFFAKGWPQYELDGIVTRSVSGQQQLLPIWHNITKDQLMACAPSLVDKIARNTAQFTIAEIAAEIADVVSESEDVA